MASQLLTDLDRLVTALRAAGVHASVDLKNLTSVGVGVWVTPFDWSADLAGDLHVRAALFLMGPKGSGRNHLDLIGSLLEQVSELVTFDEPPTYVVVNDTDRPAIRIITTTG